MHTTMSFPCLHYCGYSSQIIPSVSFLTNFCAGFWRGCHRQPLGFARTAPSGPCTYSQKSHIAVGVTTGYGDPFRSFTTQLALTAVTVPKYPGSQLFARHSNTRNLKGTMGKIDLTPSGISCRFNLFLVNLKHHRASSHCSLWER